MPEKYTFFPFVMNVYKVQYSDFHGYLAMGYVLSSAQQSINLFWNITWSSHV